jgi:S-methylmethionine-dependent homocysteine/selenocysteine methylase
MLLLDGGSTSITNFLPLSPEPIPPSLRPFWTSSYSKIAAKEVVEWHTSFPNAGSDIITTNTYQLPLPKDHPDIDINEIIYLSIDLAFKAVWGAGKGSVALSLGTRNSQGGKGEYAIEPQFSTEEYFEFHRDKIIAFNAAGKRWWDEIEYLAFETVSSYEEASAIMEVLADETMSPFIRGKKCWITFSCGDASISRMDGIISRLLELPSVRLLWGIGYNCVGVDIAIDLAGHLAKRIEGRNLMLVMYPDAGSCHDRTTAQFAYDSKPLNDEEVVHWGKVVDEIRDLNDGKVVLGGCCNTDSRFIKTLARPYSQ